MAGKASGVKTVGTMELEALATQMTWHPDGSAVWMWML